MNRPERRRLALIREVYAQVPDVGCKGLCAAACGPIGMSATEHAALVEAAAVLGLRVAVDEEGACTLLQGGRCATYEARPLICRLYGAVAALRCEHGCAPAGGFLDEARARVLQIKIRRIGGGPVYVEGAVAHVERVVNPADAKMVTAILAMIGAAGSR